MTISADFSQRPSKIIINLKNLEHNLQTIKQRVGSSKVMAVVKANAYGHGLIECAKRLEFSAVDYFGVALVEEGELLRRAGITTPIHVFGGILNTQIERFLALDLELTAPSQSKLIAIEQAAARVGTKAKVHLEIDTGMRRLGVRPESARSLIDQCNKLKHTEVRGVFSHFACSDEKDLSFTENQFELFVPILEYAKSELGSTILGHISNSAAIAQFPQADLDMVRPGLALYGVSSATHLKGSLDLAPVMSLKSQVVYFKVVKAGDSVSYGRTWTATQNSRVVTLPIGYGDGYQRALSNKASVIIGGKLYPIVGRICMDQMMVAIGDGEAFNGDEATLIGSDGAETISVEDLADLADSIPHEILSLLNLRMERKFEF
jgi:alanine racemase